MYNRINYLEKKVVELKESKKALREELKAAKEEVQNSCTRIETLNNFS
jgi:outer membrane murein-binding lipoprotein Lpp